MIFVIPVNADNIDTDDIPITYKSYIDSEYGFYKARDITTYRPAPLVGRTLTINVGDTIIWESDTLDKTFTIVSEQNLWNNADAYVKGSHTFSYIFMTSGKYNIYAKEYPKLKQYIVVKDIVMKDIVVKDPVVSITVPTIIPTVTVIPMITMSPTMTQIINSVHTSIINDDNKHKTVVNQRFFIMSIIAFALSVSLIWVLNNKI